MNTVQRNINIGKNLRNIRKQKGFTLAQVSKQTGIPRGTIGTYESYGNVGPERLKHLCDFYGVSVKWIVDKH
jgi:transcriptional regulator with XRE-family HTH domain